jgi:hypothetical protein
MRERQEISKEEKRRYLHLLEKKEGAFVVSSLPHRIN